MRRDRYDKRGGGRGRGGSSRNNRNNRSGNKRGRGGRNNRSSRGRGGYNQAAGSGNKRERIQVESGALVLIDQFMLANPQFLAKLVENIDEDSEVKDALVRDYGGTVVELSPATYRIERDPYAYTIVIHQDGELPEAETLAEQASNNLGHVFVDTRCLAMVDRELLDDSALLDKYKELWFSGQDKACRDLLRDNGGAVRYGFRRYGDELGVYNIPDKSMVALWPDVSETTPEEA